MIRFLKTALLVVLTLSSAPCIAQAAKPGFLSLSLGLLNTFDREHLEGDFRVEYRSHTPLLLNRLKPWAGIELTNEGSIWAGGGFLADFKLTDKLFLSPSFGAGAYTKGWSDVDLGYPLQFRTQLEISYVFQNDSRLGLALSHMSNAGLGDRNFGTETVSLYYTWPISWFAGI